jgi:hypothetical protein
MKCSFIAETTPHKNSPPPPPSYTLDPEHSLNVRATDSGDGGFYEEEGAVLGI